MPAPTPLSERREDVERPARDRCRRRTPTRRSAAQAGVDDVEQLGRRARRVQQRVEGGRHDVDAALQAADQVGVRLLGPGVGGGGVDDRVDVAGQRDLDVVGGGHAERLDAGQLAGVAPDLVRVRHDHADQLEVPVRGDRPDRRPAHVARPPHHHSIRHATDSIDCR